MKRVFRIAFALLSSLAGLAQAQFTLYYVHPDHLNTPRLIADTTGTPVWKSDQAEPFGVNMPDENPAGLGVFSFPLRESNYYQDTESNQRYAMFRDCYDPALGRFCQSDPIGLGGGLNTYTYVRLNPLAVVDPLGLLEHFLVELNAQAMTTMPSSFGTAFNVYSGNPPFRNDPNATAVRTLPEGTYYIVDRPVGRLESLLGPLSTKRDWFALYRRDASIDDVTMVNGVMRDKFRLHPEGALRISEGCVTVEDGAAYRVLRNRLLRTQKSQIPGTEIPYYGTITVYRPALY